MLASSTLVSLAWNNYLVGGLTLGFLVVCVIMLLTILIQKPQGGGLSAAFGAGSSSGQTAFGAKTGDALTIFTIVIFIVYLVFAVVLNWAAKPTVESGEAEMSDNSGTPATPGAGDPAAPTDVPATTPADTGTTTPAATPTTPPAATPEATPATTPSAVPPAVAPTDAPAPGTVPPATEPAPSNPTTPPGR